MKISVISFTRRGTLLGKLFISCLAEQGHTVRSFTMGEHAGDVGAEAVLEPLRDWTKRQFREAAGIIFIGAAAIAVRSIAPCLQDKTRDPAVLVLDETGKYVIPLLSGHMGGANELAYKIADYLEAAAVITTATDCNHRFAVDLFAKRNNLYISSMEGAKQISAAILHEESVGFWSDFPVEGSIVKGLTRDRSLRHGISISLGEETTVFERTLYLIPKIVTLGIGCRKGKALKEIEQAVEEALRECKISMNSVNQVASIDLKREEAGLLEFCRKYKLKFVTYPAEQLEKAPGSYEDSAYVKSVTGVGNVCERAAIIGSNNGILIQGKYAKNGVTVGIARQDWSISFE